MKKTNASAAKNKTATVGNQAPAAPQGSTIAARKKAAYSLLGIWADKDTSFFDKRKKA